MSRNYDTKLSASKLSGEIMTKNYELVYHVAENVGFIGILTYPKTIESSILFSIFLSFLFSTYISIHKVIGIYTNTIDLLL